MFKNIFIIILPILFTACVGDKEEEKWSSFIYPDKQNNKRSLKSPIIFKSLQACQEESQKQLEELDFSKLGTFKCGLNCEYNESMKLEICEKMLAKSE